VDRLLRSIVGPGLRIERLFDKVILWRI
jgi:hypothetical protein